MNRPIYPPEYALLRAIAERWAALDLCDYRDIPAIPLDFGHRLMRLIESHDYYAEKVAQVRSIVSAFGEARDE